MLQLRIFSILCYTIVFSQVNTDINLDPLLFDQNDGLFELADNGSGETGEFWHNLHSFF